MLLRCPVLKWHLAILLYWIKKNTNIYVCKEQLYFVPHRHCQLIWNDSLPCDLEQLALCPVWNRPTGTSRSIVWIFTVENLVARRKFLSLAAAMPFLPAQHALGSPYGWASMFWHTNPPVQNSTKKTKRSPYGKCTTIWYQEMCYVRELTIVLGGGQLANLSIDG